MKKDQGHSVRVTISEATANDIYRLVESALEVADEYEAKDFIACAKRVGRFVAKVDSSLVLVK